MLCIQKDLTHLEYWFNSTTTTKSIVICDMNQYSSMIYLLFTLRKLKIRYVKVTLLKWSSRIFDETMTKIFV